MAALALQGITGSPTPTRLRACYASPTDPTRCTATRSPASNLFRGLAGIDFASLGIPTEEEYVAAYCRHTGRGPVPDWDFYIVYSLFRLAAIMQGIAKRAIEGYCRER